MGTFVGHRAMSALSAEKVMPKAPTTLKHGKVPKSMAFVHLVVRSVRPILAADGTHMEYDIEMANTRNGLVWNIRKRFSRFLELQNQIDGLLEAGHCQHCSAVLDLVQDLELPPKKWALRLFSNSVVDDGLAAMRARLFCAYATGLVEIGAEKPHLQCPLIAEGYLQLVLAFLTTPSVYMEMNKIKLASRVKGGAPLMKAPPLVLQRARSGGKKMAMLETILEQECRSSTVVIKDAPSC
ncbi:hypothetical protein SPRG_00676 [Saprolegnia parasitica CBS 223.65]|uniref:PX domain-containing protein n=1 Tax=Saprolegnia parasitica (strain CBS 223.65) TaxID=695850 RepID=A0A067CVT4_SAPPC|nr:hypothetical protein SPRG_00676 [Saprolegnia parasitica CBS 223.65]KDO34613.1 hypothetical protein SPRG_00676 [Saprolegnia parasitica CBS 223.65]|eukprot:XP_012194290.1 hypothetical protein SPRG_00676 [Saprolegnia parasitica CBS 223.65]